MQQQYYANHLWLREVWTYHRLRDIKTYKISSNPNYWNVRCSWYGKEWGYNRLIARYRWSPGLVNCEVACSALVSIKTSSLVRGRFQTLKKLRQFLSCTSKCSAQILRDSRERNYRNTWSILFCIDVTRILKRRGTWVNRSLNQEQLRQDSRLLLCTPFFVCRIYEKTGRGLLSTPKINSLVGDYRRKRFNIN